MSSEAAATARDESSRLGARALAWARTHLLALFAGAAFSCGAIARVLYILVHHHPRGSVISDAIPVVNLAELLTDPAGKQQFFHTIWPPGTSAFLALTLPFDPSLGFAAVLQCLASIAIPLLALLAGRWAYGPAAGWVALALASVHFGLINYGGFFLSEQLFQVTVAVAICATLAALKPDAKPIYSGVAAGSAWALASLFRPNALPVAAFTLAWLAVRWWRNGSLKQRYRSIAAACGVAFVLLLPLAHRCSTLTGRFCPGSSNFAMNVALGHAPAGVVGLTFTPQTAELSTGPNTWTPPARMALGYQAVAEVPGSIYDSGRVLGWVFGRFRDEPLEFVLASLGNAADLFDNGYWPDDYGDLESRHVVELKQVVFVLVLVPGLAFFGLQLLRILRRREVSEATAACVAMLLGLFAVSCISMGEARYRLPFDLILIIFAARAFTRTVDPRVDAEPRPVHPKLSMITAPVLAVSALLLVLVAHPSVQLAATLRKLIGPSAPSRVELVALSDVSEVRAPGTRWDTPGVHAYTCRALACPELRVKLPARSNLPALEVSADHNDRYLVTFYRDDKPAGTAAWGVAEVSPPGLQLARVEVPPEVRAQGFDAVGIRPLYGDSRFAIGHLKLLEH
jgi:hypothetical protein